jgi:hypothetical protein
MKELNQFIRWAEDVSNSYLVEADVDKKKLSRALNTSIQSIAQRQYPDLDPQEALITYMGQKLLDMEEKDAEQIKLLNRQGQETNNLMNTVQGIRAAYDELERSSQEVEQEIDQIRDGAERAKLGQERNTFSLKSIPGQVSKINKRVDKNDQLDNRQNKEIKTAGTRAIDANHKSILAINSAKSLEDKFKNFMNNTGQNYEKRKKTDVPESYLKEIDTLAERILGEKYGKYLK